eukprot:gnl/TRDRNA2_/TRDRNA2_181333_c0_seq1.p1 gnl/TRDRNA2_/TRDRNA2_181333_c0~~gnl/TRDRNA2_/TRDRNA2_181333_c0_seq1.p1  ORF type:complete len:278 (-),score=68.49 gnl/TRDRNA2_/TRDRNA2_181333_c0_seq1:229-1062(-)
MHAFPRFVLFTLLASTTLGEEACGSSNGWQQMREGESLNLLQTKAQLVKGKPVEGAEIGSDTDEENVPATQQSSMSPVDQEKKSAAQEQATHAHFADGDGHGDATSSQQHPSKSKSTGQPLHTHPGSPPIEDSPPDEDQASPSAQESMVVIKDSPRTEVPLHTNRGSPLADNQRSPPAKDQSAPPARESAASDREHEMRVRPLHTHRSSPSAENQSSPLNEVQEEIVQAMSLAELGVEEMDEEQDVDEDDNDDDDDGDDEDADSVDGPLMTVIKRFL